MNPFSHKRTTPHTDEQRRIFVDGAYQPDTVVAPAGQPLTLVFHRRDASPCSEQVVFPHHGVRKQLVAHKDVTVQLPASPAGEYDFHCGTGMLRGRLIVR
jgi:plastocyanin domain-containing protein